MLVLTRNVGEKIIIDGNIEVTVVAVKGNKVRIGVAAPDYVRVDRQEIHERRAEFADERSVSDSGRFVGELGAAVVDFLAVHADVIGSLDADAHLVARDRNDGDLNVAVDDDLLADVTCENQHGRPSLGGQTGPRRPLRNRRSARRSLWASRTGQPVNGFMCMNRYTQSSPG
jgi:carbon storage regulator